MCTCSSISRLNDRTVFNGIHYTSLDKYAPVPLEAQGAVITLDRIARGYHVEEIAPGAFWVSQGWYDTGFFVTDKGVVVLDAPPLLGENLIEAIASVTKAPVTHMIYSHWHSDHIGASGLFGDKIIRVGHRDTAMRLNLVKDPNRPLPNEIFDDAMDLDIGNLKFELRYTGPNHCPGNIFTYVPKLKVLSAVDIICAGWVPWRNLYSGGDVLGFMSAHDDILNYDFDRVICGHLTQTATREHVLTQQEYMKDLYDFTGKALAEVDLNEIIAHQGQAHSWVMFDTYMNAMVERSTEWQLNKVTSDGRKWTERLAGADLWTQHHAYTMIQGHRLEAPSIYIQKASKRVLEVA